MEALVMILTIIVGLVALDVAALRWGIDTRPMLPDDHRR
jgi:hypothetical protein